MRVRQLFDPLQDIIEQSHKNIDPRPSHSQQCSTVSYTEARRFIGTRLSTRGAQ